VLDSFPFLLAVGTVLGFLSGIGVGGGSLLVLWLTALQNTPPETARSINLLFFLPAAIISTIFRWRQGSLDLKMLSSAAAAGCISAALFSWIGKMLDTELLRKAFGLLLIFAGIRELLYKKKRTS
jgi:uncharacterized membrane protein YfcA